MSEEMRPHPSNVEGPFYVLDGCCTACGVPESVAPEHFAWDGQNQCFVQRQPRTEAEVGRVLAAMRYAELQCIRYRGTDPEVMRRIAELDGPELCDVAPPFELKRVRRNHVTFDTAPDVSSVDALAAGFRRFLLDAPRGHFRVQPAASSAGEAALAFAWFEDHFHTVVLRANPGSDGTWLIHHPGANLGVSDTLNDWLSGDPHVSNVRWYSAASFEGDRTWRPTPW
jgi:hypothetical protein